MHFMKNIARKRGERVTTIKAKLIDYNLEGMISLDDDGNQKSEGLNYFDVTMRLKKCPVEIIQAKWLDSYYKVKAFIRHECGICFVGSVKFIEIKCDKIKIAFHDIKSVSWIDNPKNKYKVIIKSLGKGRNSEN